MSRSRHLTALLFAVILVTSSAALAGRARATGLPATAALDWNVIAVTAVRGATVPIPKFQVEGFIYMSYVQAAVSDAVTRIEGRYTPYHEFAVDSSLVADASPDAAIAAAAYATLAHYLADQPAALLSGLSATYASYLGGLPAAGKADGIAVGVAAANDIIAFRTGDGLADLSKTFTPGPATKGVWQLTPPAFAAPQTPWVASMRPFMLSNASQFRSDPPPDLSSDEWAAGFNEVKAFGGDGVTTPSQRTASETAVALFWNANAVNQYNQAWRDVATSRGLDLVDTVRLLALGEMVAADAGIGCFEAKYHYAFWRPVTAIRNAGIDDNAATTADPTWTPLIATPNHPEYPSAHGCLDGGQAEVFANVLGTNRIEVDIHGSATGAAGNFDAVHHFGKVNELTREIIDARTWAGLHYRWSTVQGVVLGRKAADWILRHYFLPVG
jgi:hypothetical protein